MELLALREQHARTLLIHYRWDVERIFELLEVKGRERLFLEAGVSAIENKGRVLSSSPCPITCNVCFDEVPPSRVSEMDCGHCFCNECKPFSLLKIKLFRDLLQEILSLSGYQLIPHYMLIT